MSCSKARKSRRLKAKKAKARPAPRDLDRDRISDAVHRAVVAIQGVREMIATEEVQGHAYGVIERASDGYRFKGEDWWPSLLKMLKPGARSNGQAKWWSNEET